jgi:hypothetical protein
LRVSESWREFLRECKKKGVVTREAQHGREHLLGGNQCDERTSHYREEEASTVEQRENCDQHLTGTWHAAYMLHELGESVGAVLGGLCESERVRRGNGEESASVRTLAGHLYT